jgi:hypothetical protein
MNGVARLTGPAARDLSREVEEDLSVKVRYGGMRVPIDALMVRELRKLGQWFERPIGHWRLGSPHSPVDSPPTSPELGNCLSSE